MLHADIVYRSLQKDFPFFNKDDLIQNIFNIGYQVG